jgi:hypothetical protein
MCFVTEQAADITEDRKPQSQGYTLIWLIWCEARIGAAHRLVRSYLKSTMILRDNAHLYQGLQHLWLQEVTLVTSGTVNHARRMMRSHRSSVLHFTPVSVSVWKEFHCSCVRPRRYMQHTAWQ